MREKTSAVSQDETAAITGGAAGIETAIAERRVEAGASGVAAFLALDAADPTGAVVSVDGRGSAH